MYKEVPLFSITNQKFNVIILAGGLGIRLKPITDYIPKALVEIGNKRAIDYIIQKYQYIADKFIIGTAYSADLLENYVKGKYSSLNVFFSREDVSELGGPGKSLIFALDYASSKLPTIITFCDYIIEDKIPTENDTICVCKPSDKPSILGTYKTITIAEEGNVINLIKNKNMNKKENGFTGVFICHNTMLLKSIVYNAAISKDKSSEISYALDIVREYILKVKTHTHPISKIFEFGTDNTLKKTREYIDGID